MDATAPARATAWARSRGRLRGVDWASLEAHLFAEHPDIQLILRIRGHALPRRGLWYLAAVAAAAAAGLAAFGLGPGRPEAAWVASGGLTLAAAGCAVVGCVRAWQGYGTNADSVWGVLLVFVAGGSAMGIGVLESELRSGTNDGPTLVFWLAIVVAALGVTGLESPMLTPNRGSERYRRALAAAAALPEAERQRIRNDLAAALDVLVERGVIGAEVRKEALDAPLGGLTAAFVRDSPG